MEVNLRIEREELNKINDEYNKKQNEYIRIKENMKTLLTMIETYKSKIDSIEKELKVNLSILEELNNKKEILESEIKEIKSKLKNLESNLNLISDELVNINNNILMLQKEKEEYLREFSAIEANLKLIDEIISKKEIKELKSYLNKTLGENLELSPDELNLLEYYYGELLNAIIIDNIDEIESIIKTTPNENIIFILKNALKNLPVKIYIKEKFDRKVDDSRSSFIFYKDKNLLITPHGFILHIVKTKKEFFHLKKKEKFF